jgi:hypothetical protein
LSQQVQIRSIYPEVAEFYDKTGLYYEPKAQDRDKILFDYMVKDREDKVVKRIGNFYRYKGGSKHQEYIYWYENWIGINHVGNRVYWGYTVGKVDIPYARYQWDENTHSSAPVDIDGYETKYSVLFNEKNMKEIEHMIYDDTQYYAKDGDRTYGGFTEEMFRDWSFDDLIYFGKTGMKPGTQVVTPDTAAEARKLEEEARKRNEKVNKPSSEKSPN